MWLRSGRMSPRAARNSPEALPDMMGRALLGGRPGMINAPCNGRQMARPVARVQAMRPAGRV